MASEPGPLTMLDIQPDAPPRRKPSPKTQSWADWALSQPHTYVQHQADRRKLRRILQAAADEYNGRFACELMVWDDNTVTFNDNPEIVSARYTDQHHVEVSIDPEAVDQTPMYIWFWRLDAFYSHFVENGPWIHMEYTVTIGDERVHFASIEDLNRSPLVWFPDDYLGELRDYFKETGHDVVGYQKTMHYGIPTIAGKYRNGNVIRVQKPAAWKYAHHMKLKEMAGSDYAQDRAKHHPKHRKPFSQLFGGYAPTWSFYTKWDNLLYPGYQNKSTKTPRPPSTLSAAPWLARKYEYQYADDPRYI